MSKLQPLEVGDRGNETQPQEDQHLAVSSSLRPWMDVYVATTIFLLRYINIKYIYTCIVAYHCV